MSFLRIAEQIRASDMVMVADLGAAHTAEKFLRPIRASAVQRIGLLWLIALNLEMLVQFFP